MSNPDCSCLSASEKEKGRDKRGPSFREETPKTASGPKYVTNVDPFQQDFAMRMAGMRQKQ
jgi:hypothetical protein